MSEHRCRLCDLEMEFIEYDPDVGIMSSYWYCDHCAVTEEYEYEPPDCEWDR
jgi:hypothetical protein